MKLIKISQLEDITSDQLDDLDQILITDVSEQDKDKRSKKVTIGQLKQLFGSGSGSNVQVNPRLTEGIHVADIVVDGNIKRLYSKDYDPEINNINQGLQSISGELGDIRNLASDLGNGLINTNTKVDDLVAQFYIITDRLDNLVTRVEILESRIPVLETDVPEGEESRMIGLDGYEDTALELSL